MHKNLRGRKYPCVWRAMSKDFQMAFGDDFGYYKWYYLRGAVRGLDRIAQRFLRRRPRWIAPVIGVGVQLALSALIPLGAFGY
jgi:hypothetical protein